MQWIEEAWLQTSNGAAAYDMMWCDITWHGDMLHDVAICDVSWCCVACYDMAWCDVTWYGIPWCDITCDKAWCDVTWHGMTQQEFAGENKEAPPTLPVVFSEWSIDSVEILSY